MITKFLSNFILTDIRCRKYIFEMNDMIQKNSTIEKENITQAYILIGIR